MVVGDEGVTLKTAEGESVTVRFAGIAGAVRNAPGELTLVAGNGDYVEITVGGWRDGEELERLLLAGVPPPGAVPGPRFEAMQAVEEIAKRDLKWRFLVSDELRGLPGLLGDGEALEHLALADRGQRAGLLALTSRRVMWLYSAILKRNDDLWELPRESIAGVRASPGIRGIVNPRLRLETPDGELKLSGISPRRKLGELEAALAVSSGSG